MKSFEGSSKNSSDEQAAKVFSGGYFEGGTKLKQKIEVHHRRGNKVSKNKKKEEIMCMQTRTKDQ